MGAGSNKRLLRVVAAATAVALGCGYIGIGSDGLSLQDRSLARAVGVEETANAPTSGQAAEGAKAAESSEQKPEALKTEVEYWRLAAESVFNRPLQLANGKLFLTTAQGVISIVDASGKEVMNKNQYVELTAPAVNSQGEIWITGHSGRLYRYDSKGNGEMAGMYYFQKKTEKLMPSSAITDGEGRPYFTYQHAVLSLDGEGNKDMYLLPAGASISSMVPAKQGVYALGSNDVLYAVHGSKLLWQVKLGETLRKAKLAADGSGGVVLVAGKALAAYEADGKVRFTRELAAAPAGGWTSPVLLPGNGGSIIAAELGGNAVMSFRLRDGAERWRASVIGAEGFGPAALTPDSSGGVVLAASRSGAVHAIDGGAGTIAHSFKHAASAAGGVVALGGGRIAYASAKLVVAAGPIRPVAVAYPAASVKLPLGTRLLLADKLKLSAPVAVSYRSDNAKVIRVSPESIVTPVGIGKANLLVDVAAPGYKGQLKLPVEITATTTKLKATYAAKKLKLSSGKTFHVQTVTIPKGMPVTLGVAKRAVGTSQALWDIAKSYGAEAAINGTYFSAYEGLPEPYGMMMSDGKLDYIGNTGTTIGFTWDNTVIMDQLRVMIRGGTNGSYDQADSWYAYFMNRTPAKGAASAILFTPKRGKKVGFNYGSSITVRKGVVTNKSRNVNASIPSDGYVLVFTGSEEKLTDRFKVGDVVNYDIETKNLSGKKVDWSRVHTAVGAGPRLVKDGKLAINAAAEGFTEAKILTSSAARSGILVKKDGTVIIATVPAATMKQWGEVMLKLGAQQAMNLDGGASSGLYAGGKIITTPGRLISNSLVFGNSLKW